MMGVANLVADYQNKMFQQLQDVMLKCDSLSRELKTVKKDVTRDVTIQLNARFDVERTNYENKISNLQSQVDSLKVQNENLKEENSKLSNEVDRLKSQINNDSNNSSLPPSSDIKPNKKNIPNNREKTSRKPGGQVAHKGHHLSKVFVEKGIKNGDFNHVVKHIGNVENDYVVKYKLDVGVVVTATEYRIHADEQGKFVVPTEFQSDVQYGNELKSICSFLNVHCNLAFNKVADFINHVTRNKLGLPASSIVNFVKLLNTSSQEILQQIETKLLNSVLMHTDATTSRNNGKNTCVRNYSTKDLTLLKVTPGKGKKYIEKTGILPKYTGNLAHDHETVMYNYGNKHVECNVHVCRYLKGNSQNTHNSWSHILRCFLLELNNYKKRLQDNGIASIALEKFDRISNRYDEILQLGYAQNKLTKSKYYRDKEQALLNRLKKYKSNHLMFLEDFDMPFDNNLSERDIRHVKGKQKVSGGFRSKIGQEAYLNIQSIFITCRKRKLDIFNTIRNLFENIPVAI